MESDNNFDKIGDIFEKRQAKKAPAYQWQELALEVIDELKIPNFKKSSVFKICKNNSRQFILNCMNDTKELCNGEEKWRYFFKLTNK